MDHLTDDQTIRRRPGRGRTAAGALLALLLLLLGAAAGCGDDEPPRAGAGAGAGGAGGDDAGGRDRSERTGGSGAAGDGGGGAAASGASPVCEDTTLVDRRAVLCTAGETPDQGLVVALHGRGSSAAEMRAVTRLEDDAAGEGLAVVYPDSLDGGWGDDTFTGPGRPRGDEDVVFLDRLIASLRADPRIGDGPVGVVGFSNGASMALRYAAQRPGDVRAAVAVAGQLPRDPAIRPAGPVSLLEVYGTGDPIRPYDAGIAATPDRQPGQPTPTLSAPDTVAAFVAALPAVATHDGPAESDPDPGDGTRLRTERWTGGDGSVVAFRTVVGGGHTWPSAHAPQPGGDRYGPVSRDVDASAEAIAFVTDPAAVR